MNTIQKYEPFVYGPPVIKNFKEENEEVHLEVALDIPPEIKLDLSAIKIESTEEKNIDVSTELEKLREINSELKSVDRKIKKGDIVFLDVNAWYVSIAGVHSTEQMLKDVQKVANVK